VFYGRRERDNHPTMAMEQGTRRPSATAAGVLAAMCVAGSERDPDVRIEDAIAPRLLRWRDGRYVAARFRPLRPVVIRAGERETPGALGYSIGRIHHMDTVVRREAAAGLDRIVILGAGYDTRAYRMRESLDGVEVVEVDHPATQREKRARIAKALGSEPAGVSFVAVDFTHQNLLERLAEHGHDLSLRTLFVLSGVSMYLPEAADFELFDQVAAHTSPRTSLLFDYVFEDAYADPEPYYGAARGMSKVAGKGEEMRSGIPQGKVEEILAAHRLRLDSHITPDELEARYLRRSDGSTFLRPFGYFGIAHAFVAGRE
jgi:methyltransferase (TIGR00027 family)